MSDKKKKSILFYIEQLERFRYLNLEERGEMITAIIDYAKDGIITIFEDRAMTILFDTFRNEMDIDAIKYERICEANRLNGRKGGLHGTKRHQTEATASEAKQTEATASEAKQTEATASETKRAEATASEAKRTEATASEAKRTEAKQAQTPNPKNQTPNPEYQSPKNQIPNTTHDTPQNESPAPDGLREAPAPMDAGNTGGMKSKEAPEAAAGDKRLRAERVRKQWEEIEWGDTQ